MAADVKKWLLGCGIGCASLIALAVIVIAVVASYIRQEFQGVERAIASHEKLSERYGEVEGYDPPPGGAVPAGRMELFLEVRESLAEPGARLESALEELRDRIGATREHSFRDALGILANLGGMISPIGEYVERRNDTLLAKGMGLGEYLYIYSLGYYSWLGHSPADGPVVRRRPGSREREHFFGEDSTFGPRALRRQYRRFTLAFLRKLRDQQTPELDEQWRDALAREIARLEDDPSAVAWERGLPQPIEEALAPYRRRLESSYRQSINCFELPAGDDNDWRRWRR